MESKRRTDSP